MTIPCPERHGKSVWKSKMYRGELITCLEWFFSSKKRGEKFLQNCKAWKYWEKKKETPEYEQFLSEHDCPINHGKSSGSMESTGTVTIFNRSNVCNRLRYKTYIGDGDTQLYHEVIKKDPYLGLIIKKVECSKSIGHRSAKPAYKIKGYKIVRW